MIKSTRNIANFAKTIFTDTGIEVASLNQPHPFFQGANGPGDKIGHQAGCSQADEGGRDQHNGDGPDKGALQCQDFIRIGHTYKPPAGLVDCGNNQRAVAF